MVLFSNEDLLNSVLLINEAMNGKVKKGKDDIYSRLSILCTMVLFCIYTGQTETSLIAYRLS